MPKNPTPTDRLAAASLAHEQIPMPDRLLVTSHKALQMMHAETADKVVHQLSCAFLVAEEYDFAASRKNFLEGFVIEAGSRMAAISSLLAEVEASPVFQAARKAVEAALAEVEAGRNAVQAEREEHEVLRRGLAEAVEIATAKADSAPDVVAARKALAAHGPSI